MVVLSFTWPNSGDTVHNAKAELIEIITAIHAGKQLRSSLKHHLTTPT